MASGLDRVENLEGKKQIILNLIKKNGPCLPIHVSREMGVNTLFASAFLSEMLDDKEIMLTYMKMGGSPLYYLQGQEPLLEPFFKYLPGKEREAFLLLKKNRILQDDKQLPAIRVALRSLRDFAFPITVNFPNNNL